MRIDRVFALAILFVISCSKDKKYMENEPFSPLSSTYIRLKSEEGNEFCISYSELTKVTKFDYLKLEVGKEDRIKIICGVVRLTLKDFNKMMKDPHSPIYEVSFDVKPVLLDSLMTAAMDTSGIFKIQGLKGVTRGNIIAHAISKGYSIYFDDYRGNYYWIKSK